MHVTIYANNLNIPVTSGFGWRNDPITSEWKFHCGVDLGYDYDTPIPALFDGIIISAGNFEDGYGNCVLIYHPERDAYTRYAHCNTLNVFVGQEVVSGYIIGYVGNTGRSTGAHLHLEYITNTGSGYQYSDPMLLWE